MIVILKIFILFYVMVFLNLNDVFFNRIGRKVVELEEFSFRGKWCINIEINYVKLYKCFY